MEQLFRPAYKNKTSFMKLHSEGPGRYRTYVVDNMPSINNGASNVPDGSSPAVEVLGNSIYFYSEVSEPRILSLNKALKELQTKSLVDSIKHGTQPAPITIYIMSPGGGIFAGLSAMDTIAEISRKVPVHTVVDGYAASAATFISLAGTKRFIRENSYMMIHQLSSVCWGKYDAIKDEVENLDYFMHVIKQLYKKKTRVPMKDIDNILKRDMWWHADRCKELSLVDEII